MFHIASYFSWHFDKYHKDMERNLFFEDRTKNQRKVVTKERTNVKHYHDCRHKNRVVSIGPSISASSSARQSPTSCCCKATEFVCSACLLCVACPLAIFWCCVELPCKLGWRATRRAVSWACYGLEPRVVAADYSSFSDIDLDSLPTTCKVNRGV